MERLTQPTCDCFEYDLKAMAEKDINERVGEFKNYDVLYAYLKAVQTLGKYEDLNRTPEELAADLALLEKYKAKGKPEGLVRVGGCEGCFWNDRFFSGCSVCSRKARDRYEPKEAPNAPEGAEAKEIKQ